MLCWLCLGEFEKEQLAPEDHSCAIQQHVGVK
jgi:hypothetical protein